MLHEPRWLNAFTNLIIQAYVPNKPKSSKACEQALSDLQHNDTSATVPDVQAELHKIFEFEQIFDEIEWKVTIGDVDKAIKQYVNQCNAQDVGSALNGLKKTTKIDALRACGASNLNCKLRGNRAWAGIKLQNQF